jgi:hypothetical protein
MDAADASGSNDSEGITISSADASDASDSATNPGPIPQPAYGAPVPVYGGSPMPLYGGSPVRVDE